MSQRACGENKRRARLGIGIADWSFEKTRYHRSRDGVAQGIAQPLHTLTPDRGRKLADQLNHRPRK